MAADLAALRRDRAKASARMSEIAAAARGRSMTDDEFSSFETASNEVTRLDGAIVAAEGQIETARESTASIGRADAAEISRLCTAGGVPAMAATLLAEGIGVDEAKQRVAAAGEAKNLVALARAKDPSIPEDLAATMLADGKGVEAIRTALFDKLVAGEAKTAIASHVPVETSQAGAAASSASMAREIKRAGLNKEA